MTKKKIDALDALHGDYTLKERNAAIVYLHEEKDYDVSTLAELSHLAVSTIKNYLRKFADLLEWAKEIFYKGKTKAKKTAQYFWCYIDKITLEDGRVWCKIGQTTEATPEKRAKRFSWKKDGITIKPACTQVYHKIACKNATAMQNMEDLLRIGMTEIDPDGYIKNDRLDSWEEDYPQRILENEFVRMGLAQFAA